MNEDDTKLLVTATYIYDIIDGKAVKIVENGFIEEKDFLPY